MDEICTRLRYPKFQTLLNSHKIRTNGHAKTDKIYEKVQILHRHMGIGVRLSKIPIWCMIIWHANVIQAHLLKIVLNLFL